ncbi:182 kDa tankyrase-1-binding protein-like isoform X1 [Oncorhynchus kisutch]|nr:182 kDa tankyrase-1-binding protein-like isoform X1 [Oncorhynchus kisutch]
MKEDERQREKEQARERQREEEREKEQVESPVQLITFEPDHSPKPELPSRSPTIPIIEPILKDEEQPHIKVVYSFSNKEEKPLLEVVNDNFSIKLGRWGSQTRLLADCAQDETSSPGRLLGLQKTVVNTQEALNVKSHPAEGNIEWVVPAPENRMEKVDEEEEANVDTEEEQLKCCVGAGEGHDTEALIGGELDKQYGGCDTRLSEDDSLQTTVEQISPVTPDEPNSTSPLEETEELLAFPDISPLLDTSAQRARAKLRKSRRTRPPRAVHQNSTTATLEENRIHDWRFCDSSDKVDSLTRGDCESDEEQPRGREVPSQPQRIPLFSGMDPSALKAQLKKRTGGGVKGADTDSQTDSLALSPSQLSRSPGCSSFLPRTSQILPPVVNKDGGGDSSPSWLQELKSKKRLSQYNSED